jgi:hypothetical protein
MAYTGHTKSKRPRGDLYSLAAYHHHVVWVFVRRAAPGEISTQEEVIPSEVFPLHEIACTARWLVLDVGKGPLFTKLHYNQMLLPRQQIEALAPEIEPGST